LPGAGSLTRLVAAAVAQTKVVKGGARVRRRMVRVLECLGPQPSRLRVSAPVLVTGSREEPSPITGLRGGGPWGDAQHTAGVCRALQFEKQFAGLDTGGTEHVLADERQLAKSVAGLQGRFEIRFG